MTNLEKIQNSDKKFIVAADEVGWGALAGKLVVCGVKALKDWKIEGLKDSKKLTPNQREVMNKKLKVCNSNKEFAYVIAERTNKEIDKIGVGKALKDCYAEIFIQLSCSDSVLVVDGNLKFDDLKSKGYDIISLIKADNQIPAVMAASIIAKVYRDTEMIALDKICPGYDFANSKGYPSVKNKDGIKKLGFSPYHRLSYKVNLD